MKSCRCHGQMFLFSGQTRETSHPGEAAINDPTCGQQHKAAFGLGQFDDLKGRFALFDRLLWLLTRVIFVNKGHFEALLSDLLECLRFLGNLRSALFIGIRGVLRRQVTNSIYRHMLLRPFLATVPIMIGTTSAFGSRLRCANIGGCRHWFGGSSSHKTRHQARVVNNGPETARCKPAEAFSVKGVYSMRTGEIGDGARARKGGGSRYWRETLLTAESPWHRQPLAAKTADTIADIPFRQMRWSP